MFTITFVSVIVALMMGGIEAIGVLKDQLNLTGGFLGFYRQPKRQLWHFGFVIIGVFVLSWAGSVIRGSLGCGCAALAKLGAMRVRRKRGLILSFVRIICLIHSFD
jgi:high-affinity nickel-transport protein